MDKTDNFTCLSSYACPEHSTDCEDEYGCTCRHTGKCEACVFQNDTTTDTCKGCIHYDEKQ